MIFLRPALLVLLATHQAQAACDVSASYTDRPVAEVIENGCSYGACEAGTSINDWTCVHDASFCEGSTYRTPAEVMAAGGSCTCKDILGFPSLVGICESNAILSPMALTSHCSKGNPVCTADDGGKYTIGDPGLMQFTACDLPCYHGNGHEGMIPEGTYQSCEVPSFEWATYNVGANGGMAGNNIAVTTVDGTTIVIVAGEVQGPIEMKGPFTASDPTGSGGSSASYEPPEDVSEARRPWDAGFYFVNGDTGEPISVLSVFNPDTAYVHGFGISPDGTLMALGGEFAPSQPGMSGTTNSCTPVQYNDGGAETVCDGTTTNLKPHATGWPGYIIAANPQTKVIEYMIQAPWLQLTDQEVLDGRTLSEHSVLGIQIATDNSLYITGFKALVMKDGVDPPDGEPPNKYTGVACKLNSDGSLVWMKQYPELKYAVKSDLHEASGGFFFAAEMEQVEEPGELGVTCTNPTNGGCSLLVRISMDDGEVDWARVAHGYNDRPWESGEVHLGDESEGTPYVYAAFQEAGTHGPTFLDDGTSYAGCRLSDGSVAPEYDEQFKDIVLSQDDCTGIDGIYFSRTSEFAIPAYAANSGAHCMGYEATSCLVKFNAMNGFPIWGATKPRTYSFVPQADGITAIGTSSEGATIFDTVDAGGPAGSLDGWGHNWVSKMTLDGVGVSVETILSFKSYTGGPALAAGPNGEIFLTQYIASPKAKLGPSGPGGFTLETGLITGCANPETDVVCEEDFQRLLVTKLGDTFTPSCIQSCDSGVENASIVPGTCFVGQTCYEDGESAEWIGLPCKVCNSAMSQDGFDDNGIGTDFCYIDGACYREDGARQLPSGRSTIPSECEYCSPTMGSDSWSLRDGYELIEGECAPLNAPVTPPVDTPGAPPTSDPVAPPTDTPAETGSGAMPTKVIATAVSASVLAAVLSCL